jgi:transglutaminase-like putative cysteine protease
MLIRIGYDIVFDFPAPTPMLLMLNTHPSEAHRLRGPDCPRTEPDLPMTEFIDGFGNRCHRLVAPAGKLRLRNDTLVEDNGLPDRQTPPDTTQHRIEDLPDECLPFLLASRYCEVAEMLSIAWELFGQTPPGWARVDAICDWVNGHVEFGYRYARPSKTAVDVFLERRGVCRDFTHLAVTFCRCLNIPARYCNGYLGDIGVPSDPAPMDFNAWFEVYLGGRWHTFDARHNEPRIGRVLMTRGRDAVDIAMTTAFGANALEQFIVLTEEVPGP